MRKAALSKPGESRRAAGYIRVSALMGRDGESFLSDTIQREKVEAWSTFKSWPVTRWYIDLDVSAYRANVRRPEFERMMADARAGAFEIVAVYKLTRFARTTRAAALALDELDQLGVGLVSVTEDIDTTTAGGKFMRNMLFAMAEFEAERIGEEWRNVHANRRRRGLVHISRPVFGYRNEAARIVGVEDVEAAAVRLMFNLRSQRLSYGAIRKRLEADGYTTKHGHTRFSTPTIRYILGNPIYAGLLKDPDGDGYIEAQHEAIVGRDLWETVQRMHRPANRHARYRAGLLSGLMVCSSCGYRMRYEAGNGTSRRPSIYRCQNYSHGSEPCTNGMHIQAKFAEPHIDDLYVRRIDPKRMPNKGRVKASQRQAQWQRKATQLRARADELTRALDSLADQRYMKGSLKADEYERQFERYSVERAKAMEQADELEAMATALRPLDRGVLDVWHDPRTPLAIRQQALRRVIDRIEVLPSPRTGVGQEAFTGERLRVTWLI